MTPDVAYNFAVAVSRGNLHAVEVGLTIATIAALTAFALGIAAPAGAAGAAGAGAGAGIMALAG
jgi:hypothetical protein